VKSLVGASKPKLEEAVKQLAENDKEKLLQQVLDSGDVVEGEAEKVGDRDLGDSVDFSRSEALNDQPNHTFANIFKADESFCQSDVDPQLLFTIAFKRVSSLKSIKIVAPDDGSGPKRLKIFVNRPNMGFSEVDEFTPSQTILLKPEDLKADTPATMFDMARFLKTDTLTLFIETNQGGVDQTKLSRLILWGK